MSLKMTRYMIILLSFLTLLISITVKNEILSVALVAVCLLLALFLFCTHLSELTALPADHPKMKTVKLITAFNVILVLICIGCAVLMETGLWTPTEHEEAYFAALIVVAVILFCGNLAPKLPFNRHTGLRLPWTVTDEDTWIVAHRILGYISIPLALFYIACIPLAQNFEVLSLITILLWAGIPSGVSYLFFRQKWRSR